MVTPTLPNDGLSRFLLWWLNQPIVTINPLNTEVCPSGLTTNGNVVTLVLFRKGIYQVELITLLPNATAWPGEHRHPNVDSYEIALYNCVNFTKNGQLCNDPEYLIDFNCYSSSPPVVKAVAAVVRLLPTDFHGTTQLAAGGALISVQQWQNGVLPTSVGLDWIGQPVNEAHKAQHNQMGNTATRYLNIADGNLMDM